MTLWQSGELAATITVATQKKTSTVKLALRLSRGWRDAMIENLKLVLQTPYALPFPLRFALFPEATHSATLLEISFPRPPPAVLKYRC